MAGFALERFGWDGLTVPADLKEISKNLPTASHLKVLRPSQSLSGVDVYFPYNFFHDGAEKYMPAYIKETAINDGGYAVIYSGRRAIYKPKEAENNTFTLEKHSGFEPICIKRINLNILPEEDEQTPASRDKTYDDEIKAILYEAYIHAVICDLFEREGYPMAIPHLYEICAISKDWSDTHEKTEIDSIWIIMELLNGITLEKFLMRNLVIGSREDNDRIMIDVILQVSFYLHLLQEKLHFNHRDLKINNIFVRHHESSWSHTIKSPIFGSWTCKNDIILIDFGFACISCGPQSPTPRATLLGAGSWFRQEHDCMKYGRDIGQFLFSVHCQFPFEQYLTPKLSRVLRQALTAKLGTGTVDVLNGFENDGRPRTNTSYRPMFNNGIYIFLRDNTVDIPGCRPAVLIKTLMDSFIPKR